MSDTVQWAIIAFIIISISAVMWKGGAANPEGTGKLAKEVGAMKGELTGLSTRIGYVEHEMEALKEESASTEDITALRALFEEKISTVRAELSGSRELAQRTYNSVERMERFMIDRGINGGR